MLVFVYLSLCNDLPVIAPLSTYRDQRTDGEIAEREMRTASVSVGYELEQLRDEDG